MRDEDVELKKDEDVQSVKKESLTSNKNTGTTNISYSEDGVTWKNDQSRQKY